MVVQMGSLNVMMEHVLQELKKMMVGVTAVSVKMILVLVVVTKTVIVVIAAYLAIVLMIVMMVVVEETVNFLIAKDKKHVDMRDG